MSGDGSASLVRTRRRWALRVALVANSVLLAAEVGFGLGFHSLTLLADAVHLLTDVEKVLRIVRKYYDTGSYAELDAVK